MDYRRMKLISWSNGYDFRDFGQWGNHTGRVATAYRRIVARRVRKQEARAVRDEAEEGESEFHSAFLLED